MHGGLTLLNNTISIFQVAWIPFFSMCFFHMIDYFNRYLRYRKSKGRNCQQPAARTNCSPDSPSSSSLPWAADEEDQATPDSDCIGFPIQARPRETEEWDWRSGAGGRPQICLVCEPCQKGQKIAPTFGGQAEKGQATSLSQVCARKGHT